MNYMRLPKVTEEEYSRLVRKHEPKPELLAAFGAKRANKYRAVKKMVDGYTFASTGEARRYAELAMLQKAGRIKDLTLQYRFPIRINNVTVCDYIADFVYEEDGRVVVEDYKGFRTPLYALKRKLMEAVHGITIRETSARG